MECCSPGSQAQCPIMVWFHPGDFSTGDGSPQKYGPQLLMEQNTVLVSINSRYEKSLEIPHLTDCLRKLNIGGAARLLDKIS